jgi:single-strand DNA-binding protein
MNHAVFVGRIGQTAELRQTAAGKAVANFSLAVDGGRDASGQKRDPLWLKCVLWEKRAEALAQFCVKGKMVVICGSVGCEAWLARQDGGAQAAIVVNVREITFCGGGEDSKKTA